MMPVSSSRSYLLREPFGHSMTASISTGRCYGRHLIARQGETPNVNRPYILGAASIDFGRVMTLDADGSASNTRGALDGLRVVEAGLLVQGPQAAATLSDWGADVIKVE